MNICSGPVSERAMKVALTVTENVVKKDFALDGEEMDIRRSAHNMMRAMTAGMAAITCRLGCMQPTACLVFLNFVSSGIT